MRLLLFTALMGVLFAHCTNDDNGGGDPTMDPPTNVDAVINISTDDSGTVTITPSAEGASSFDVYFGDTANETPTEVQNGQSTSHVYAEGNYTIRIVAKGPTGLTAETTKDIMVSFTVPSNLTVTATVSNTNPFEVTFEPMADDATMFEIFPGEDPNESPAMIMAGETYTHTYAATGTYTATVIAKGASSQTATATVDIEIAGATAPVTLPVDFDDATVNFAFTNFGGNTTTIVDNPDTNGNSSGKVAKAFKEAGAEVWAGSFLQMVDPIDFSNNKTLFKIDVWSPKMGAVVRLKIENADDPNIFYEADATTMTSNAWETLEWDFSGADMAQSFHKIVIFFDFGNAGDGSEYYFDNIRLEDNNGGGGGTGTCTKLANFEFSGYSFTDFGNAFSTVIPNPDMSGINTTANVVELNKTAGAETWAGGFFELSSPIDFANNPYVKVKVWSPKSGAVVKMKVENLADNNINAEVDQTTTTSNAWEELTYDFSGIDMSQEYARLVMFFDFGNAGDDTKYYYDEIVICSDPAADSSMASGDGDGGADNGGGGGGGGGEMPFNLDFEADPSTYMFTNFGNAFSSVIANPDMSGINTSAQVAQTEKTAGAETWAGSFLELPDPIDLANNPKIKVKVWSPIAGAVVKVKIENLANNNFAAEVDMTTTTSNAWEELTYDFSGADMSDTYQRVVIFFDFGNAGDGSFFYYDDFRSEP